MPHGHADAVRAAVGGDEINSGDFGFFAAIFGVGGNVERLAVRAKNRAAAFVKPFGRDADLSCGRAAACDTPAKHFHAVGEVFAGDGVHVLAIARAAEMREAGAGNEAAGRLGGMINRREEAPVGLAVVDGIVIKHEVREFLPHEGG